ncbi:phospholipase [Panacibacter ginsenosidivorans]|uniref:Phospholipase n=1 Tax=Panacibacter ginsenosidivorans TaxID=1813871 RepID=A0A5B8V3Z6_9BACT|nr:phospholipase D-like domain-containing protein [Panacibacter ginsenosidivorans]QEC66247.1 phospholipase [Panacibacter ginsenosidivorans]
MSPRNNADTSIKSANPKKSGGYSSCNKIKLVHSGQEYFNQLLYLIDSAKESIHLQVYIFESDETGHTISTALKSAAKRNVQVFLLTDGFASQHLPRKFIQDLKEAGVHFRFFEPLFRSKYFYFGRRMHHKIFVADAKYALAGGINIADRYNKIHGNNTWFDLALYIEGDIAQELCVLCWKTWKSFPVKMGLTPCEEKRLSFLFKEEETCNVRMRRNDWVRRKNEISVSYIELFRKANEHITIMCSYFLPGKAIRRLLVNAAKRGVKIKVIIAGPSDVILAKYAERWLYDWLLRNNIELYEYQPTILHAKIATGDNEWLTIGSYNINNISAYASIELNIDVRNNLFVTKAENMLTNIITNDCINITSEKHSKNKNFIKQFARWCSYQIIRIVFYSVTFYYKRSH